MTSTSTSEIGNSPARQNKKRTNKNLRQKAVKSVHQLKLFGLQKLSFQMQAPEPISHPVR